MKVLVTGGAGFIGSHVCEKLIEGGASVVCVDNLNDYYDPKIKKKNLKSIIGKNLKFYEADIRKFSIMKKIFERNKPDKIIHLAAMVGIRYSIKFPILYEEVNVKGTLNLLEIARLFKIGKFVYGSSSSVYGNNRKMPFSETDNTDSPISPYAATKKAGEILCKNYHILYGIDISCLRFFTVYGPRGRPDMAVYKFTRLINDEKPIPVFGNGLSKRDYTNVNDIVLGVLPSLDKNVGFSIFNLGGSSPVELNYLISLIESNVGKKAKIKREPEQLGDVEMTYADISKSQKTLNFKPRIKIEEGIEEFVRWYKNER